MCMFSSCEVRWFFPEAPLLLADWFARRGLHFHPGSESLRCDFYLRQPRRRDLGIKLREGNIEVKERTRSRGIRRFSASVAGRVEYWRKWSFRLASTREGGTDEVLAITRGANPKDWIPVFKDRLLILYEIREEGRVVLLDQPFHLQEGCGIELTRIQSRGHTWFTFGLEAFSAGQHTGRNLRSAMDAFLADVPDLVLPEEQSMSYPAFLASL